MYPLKGFILFSAFSYENRDCLERIPAAVDYFEVEVAAGGVA